MSAADTALLALRNVGHHFGGLSVLTDVNFQVNAGEIVGLIGPNGSGKTTCFNIVSGFIQPKKGQVFYQGEDVTGQSVQAPSRNGLLRTFQTPKVFEHMSVLENLMVGTYKSTSSSFLANLLKLKSARAEIEAMTCRALALSERFGLNALLGARAGELPAGQRRIVELARACASSPHILLLDEPSSGLNSSEVALLRDWIVELNRGGLTMLLVSHDMGLMTVAQRVHALYFGKIICSGNMDVVREDAQVREAYLGA